MSRWAPSTLLGRTFLFLLPPGLRDTCGLAVFRSGGHSLSAGVRSPMTYVKVVKKETLGRSPLEETLQIIVI